MNKNKLKIKTPKRLAHPPLVVGLTGGVGCGKSEVAGVFAELGAIIISGDQIGHQVVKQSGPLQRRLAREFGTDILTGRGVNRRKLARRAFATTTGREKLNRLIHPALIIALNRQVTAARRRGDLPLVVIDAALLVEWDEQVPLDYLVAIEATRADRRRWLSKRGWSDTEITARMQAQLPFSARRTVADYVLRNDGTRRDLHRKALRLWQKLTVSC